MLMRSKLFVPASRPELFDKALASQADALSFDLEDAVEAGSKDRARAALVSLLDSASSAAMQSKSIVVRVNGTDTNHFEKDIDAVVRPGLAVLNLPMVESVDAVRFAVNAIESLERRNGVRTPIGLLVNIESARGLRMAADIAKAHGRVIGLQIGYGDLFAPLGIVQGEPSAVQMVRVAVRMAAGEAGIDAYDGAYVQVSDPEGYVRDAHAARRLGFAGKSCIHPSQVPLANEAFAPRPDEVAHARRVVEAATRHLANGVGAFLVDGRLIDGPFILEAERTVAASAMIPTCVRPS